MLDANVLYPAYLRDALLRLAEAEVYQVRWSRQILDEMSRNELKNNPDMPEESMERLVRTMEKAFPDAMVAGHEPLIPSMTNDPKESALALHHLRRSAILELVDLTARRVITMHSPIKLVWCSNDS